MYVVILQAKQDAFGHFVMRAEHQCRYFIKRQPFGQLSASIDGQSAEMYPLRKRGDAELGERGAIAALAVVNIGDWRIPPQIGDPPVAGVEELARRQIAGLKIVVADEVVLRRCRSERALQN